MTRVEQLQQPAMRNQTHHSRTGPGTFTRPEEPAVCVMNTMTGVLTHVLSPARVHCHADFESLAHTPESATDPAFLQSVAAISSAIAASVLSQQPEAEDGYDIVVVFTGIPASGTV